MNTVRTLAGYIVAAAVMAGGILFVAAFTTGTDPWQDLLRPVAAWCGNHIT